MKKLVNTFLAAAAIVGILAAALSNGLVFLVGLILGFAAFIGILKYNTDYIENY